MNWQPMSTPPTEAGEYLLWKKDTTDGCSARLRFNPDDEYCWWTLFGWSKHTTVKKSYTHWARVTAPGEDRGYTALAVMDAAGKFETDQIIGMTDEFAAAILYEDNEDGLRCAQIGAVMHGGRVVRVRSRVEEV